MKSRAELTVSVDVAAPSEALWRTVTDWPGQSAWMLGTRVEVTSGGDGRERGARLRAVTGVGPFGIVDPIEIVEWDPPRRCVVRHLGRVVRGPGIFEVVELGPERARLRWSELLDLPLGALGRLGWLVTRPIFRAGLQLSFRRMSQLCEAEHRTRD